MIYTSEHYGTAMLEKLVRYNGVLPPNQHFIEIEIPSGVSYEVVTKDTLPGWDRPNGAESREFGRKWIEETRSAILFVPSIVSREENNVLIKAQRVEATDGTGMLSMSYWLYFAEIFYENSDYFEVLIDNNQIDFVPLSYRFLRF